MRINGRKQGKKVKNHNGSKMHSGFIRVPRANVIDLKKLVKEKEKQAAQKNESVILNMVKKVQWPKLNLGTFFRQRRKTQEKVIISQKANVSSKFQPARLKSHKKEVPPQVKVLVSQQIADLPGEKIFWRQSQLMPGWSKKLLGFVIACLLIILPVYMVTFYQQAIEAKGRVLGISSEAYKNLQAAGQLASQSEFRSASENFDKASQNFIDAQDQLKGIGEAVLAIIKIVPSQAKSAQYLLTAGEHISQAGALLTDLVDDIQELNIDPLGQSESSLTEYLSIVNSDLVPVQNHIKKAADDLANVRVKDLPEDYRLNIEQAKTVLPTVSDNFHSFSSLANVLLQVLGHESPKRYLLVFQNSRELRPTGGFIGSIALVDIYQGEINNLEVPGGGVYDVAGQLREKIIAPKPLWLVNPHWNIQDCNWFLDFPASARKLMWFFERTGQTTVDGIISLTPRVIEDLLKITGPINMEDDYGATVDHNNFIRQAQYWAEVEYDREENEPKKFIGDLMPKLLSSIFQTKTDAIINVLGVIGQSLNSKDFLLYFNEQSVQQVMADFSWDGAVKQTDKDYLAVVSTNIAGGKTDHVVDQLIEHKSEISSNGSIINTVKVTRIHQGNSLDRWESAANVSYLRFYVPAGSELLEINGYSEIPSFRYQLPDEDALHDEDLLAIQGKAIIDELTNTRITSEFGKTVFGNWLSLDPGGAGTVTVKYKLPYKIEIGGLLNKTDSYSLLVQKQPGFDNNFLSSTVIFPEEYNIIWQSEDLSIVNNLVEYISDIDADKYFGFLLSK